MSDACLMPDGRPFGFWDDTTLYDRTYHVAAEAPRASDDNPGTADRPLKSISRAAELLEPGQKAVIHAGVYRECVRPARGGEGPDRMIAYEAAPGEDVLVKGSREWRGPFSRSTGHRSRDGRTTAPAWMGDLPPDWFSGFNPFLASNMRAKYLSMDSDWARDRTVGLTGCQGMLFANGQALRQVCAYAELIEGDGAFWVEPSGTRLHFRLREDTPPDSCRLEATVREQVFAPAVRELGYIRLSGLRLEHAGDPVSPPQRALLSTGRGHHWIIEDCTVRHAHAIGIDVGRETWGADPVRVSGGHILRRNRVSDCGQCGIAGFEHVDETLIENNLIERIGHLDIEWTEESAGLKIHISDRVLLRGNVFRDIRHAAGLWMDYLCSHCRVTDNVFVNIRTMLGATYFEGPQRPNWIDRNVYCRIENGDHRSPQPPWVEHGGLAVDCDCGEYLVVAHNLFLKAAGRAAVGLHLQQNGRRFGGRTGLCRRQAILNNVFCACRRPIHLGRLEDNRSDGNAFAPPLPGPACSVRYPEPCRELTLEAWQEHLGRDLHSGTPAMDMVFDAETLILRLGGVEAPPPPVESAPFGDPADGCGPLTAEEWAGAAQGPIEVSFPRRA